MTAYYEDAAAIAIAMYIHGEIAFDEIDRVTDEFAYELMIDEGRV